MRRHRRSDRDNALQKRPGAIRIVGGAWRGRRLRVPELEGLRPTPDRVRETLFNWLAQAVPGSRCLDLFAGSGALGLEALSRGAAHATFVERDREAVRRIAESIEALGAGERARLVEGDGLAWLARAPEPYDVAFLDPPFDSGLGEAAAAALEDGGWLAPGAFVYLERPASAGPPALPATWRLHRSGRAGAVGYHLAQRAGTGG